MVDAEEEAAAAESAEPAEALKATLSEFKTELMKDINKTIDTKLSKNQDETKELIKKLPAFAAEDIDGNFSKHTPESDGERSIGDRLNGGYVHREK